MIADFACTVLENAINQALRLDPDTKKRLKPLQGKVIKVTITDWSLNLYLLLKSEGVQLQTHFSKKPDTTIRGTLSGLLRVACQGASGVALFEQGVQIEGDTELGEKIREILKQLDLDWEGNVAKIFGDSFTHAFSWRAKKTLELCKQTSQNLAHQYREYWQFEKNYLPSAEQVGAFYKDIEQLKEDVDRAEARLARLEKRLSSL